MSKNEWLSFVNKLIQEDSHEVIGVKETTLSSEKYTFGPLESAEELRLDYDVTILPPKKYFLPTHEDIMRYDLTKPFAAEDTAIVTPRIIIGVHSYDLIALQQMDKVYLDDIPDDHYRARRKNTLIIASDILKVSPHSFAASMNTHITDSGYDLLVSDLGSSVVIDEGSVAGKKLLARYGSAKDASEDDINKVSELRSKKALEYEKRVNVDKTQWPNLIAANSSHPVYEEKSKTCFECGSCVLVCPTCYCYDVKDINAPNLNEGVRGRTWDACLLREFTLVGSGEIFRESVVDRFRHRIFRKGYYLPQRYDFTACVGCGRCVSACLADIADPSDVINTIAASPISDQQLLHLPQIPSAPFVSEESAPLLIPSSATIKRIEKMTECETLYELEMDNHSPLEYQPGQFIQVSVFGIGEAPISLSSAPGEKTFEIVVRDIGDVTTNLKTLKVGDKVGIRGPFGRGFDIEALKGKDLLFIAGGLGIVPMRSLINYVLDHRSDFNKVTILYGCKNPGEFLFEEEALQWHDRDDVEHMFTVDKCPEGICWEGNIGVITTLIPKVTLNPQTTIAVVVGPPIMYRFVIKDLKKKGMPDEHILVSLERRMKCGVGKCGHCQINGVYVCREGPVFNYKDMKDLPEAF